MCIWSVGFEIWRFGVSGLDSGLWVLRARGCGDLTLLSCHSSPSFGHAVCVVSIHTGEPD